MPGEFRGDVTRDGFDPSKHFTQVLMQQGRVQLDSDSNEQTSILWHYLRTLAADLIGRHAAASDDSFSISKSGADGFVIGMGRYYVDGILCENDAPPGHPFPDTQLDAKGNLVYLDVWERHITCVEDDDIREVALGGPDTASRAQVVFQVKVFGLDPKNSPDRADAVKTLNKAVADLVKKTPADPVADRKTIDDQVLDNKLFPKTTGSLRARAQHASKPEELCGSSPSARYTGIENQLYRVEIQRSGKAWDGKAGPTAKTAATCKWSRDNGSVVFPILTLSGGQVTLAHFGRDVRHTLQTGDWVEIVDDDVALRGEPGVLWQIKTVDLDDMSVTLDVPSGATLPVYDETSDKHPLLRRWDQQGKGANLQGGALLVAEGQDDANWITLEDGVQIQFSPAADGAPASEYRAGDYWLIPARTATSDVIWPTRPDGQHAAQPPHGVEHHYAPLALLTPDAGAFVVTDLRRILHKP